MFISLIGGISWGMAVWVTEKDNESVNINKIANTVTEIRDTLNYQNDQIKNLRIQIKQFAWDQKILTNNYIRYVKANTKFTDEFTKYMEGLTFTLDIQKGYEPKIRIEKIE